MDALKKLDRKAKRPARVTAIVVGVASTLLLGLGMCFCLGAIGVVTSATMGVGICMGLIGIAGMAANYPLFKINIEKGKRRYAFEVMELTREIAGE